MTHPQSPIPGRQPLILASRSPRRRELLAEAGYDFQVIAPDEDVECGFSSASGPAGLVAELAYRKAAAVARKLQDSPLPVPNRQPAAPSLILSADTIAEYDGLILGKPRDEADARRMLRQLSNREHRVLTGVCLVPLNSPLPPFVGWPWRGEDGAPGAPLIRVDVTKLRMDALSDTQLDEYLSSGHWEGKAGAFGYQDRLGWVHIVEGSPSNVVGLPMELLSEMLKEITQPN
jgi:septum formation protein